jgi:hypothetical protein
MYFTSSRKLMPVHRRRVPATRPGPGFEGPVPRGIKQQSDSQSVRGVQPVRYSVTARPGTTGPEDAALASGAAFQQSGIALFRQDDRRLGLCMCPDIGAGFAGGIHGAALPVVTFRVLPDFGFSGPSLC